MQMNYWYSTVLVLSTLVGLNSAEAQVVLSLNGPALVDAGEQFTVDAAVTGFTDITSAQFELAWDPAVLSIEDVEIPVDSFAMNSPFTASQLTGKATFLYVEQTATTGGTLASGAVLLRLTMRASGEPGDSTCIDVVTDRIGVEFIERAQTELNVEVAKASVHLRESVSIPSHEQTKLTATWLAANALQLDDLTPGLARRLQLYDLQGRLLADTPVAPSLTSTTLWLATPAIGSSLVLVVRQVHTNHTLLIPGPR